MSSPLTALEQLLALSEAMLGAAEEGDWDTLASHETQRRALADSLPAALTRDLPPAAQATARALIEGCQRCDARIHPLIEARLTELRVVLRQTVMAVADTPNSESHDRFPSLAGRIPACTPESLAGHGACSANSPARPPPLSHQRAREGS
jgi:hypothetical protein